MGVKFTPIILKKEIHLDDLGGKVLAVDGNGLYKFLCKERDFSPERVKMIIERMKVER